MVGRIQIGGFRLGVAAVLFVGLGLATIEPDIALPAIVFIMGLSLFVYTIGLEAGPDFFSSMRTTGLRLNALAIGMIVATMAVGVGLLKFLGIDAASGAGGIHWRYDQHPCYGRRGGYLDQHGVDTRGSSGS